MKNKPASSKVTPQSKVEDVSPLQTEINQATATHTEVGSLAFAFAKAMVNSRTDLTTSTSNELRDIITTSFELSDLLKSEMDQRYNAAVNLIRSKYAGPSGKSLATAVSETLNVNK